MPPITRAQTRERSPVHILIMIPAPLNRLPPRHGCLKVAPRRLRARNEPRASSCTLSSPSAPKTSEVDPGALVVEMCLPRRARRAAVARQPEVKHLDDGLDEPDGGGVADYDVACGLIVGEKFEAVADVHGYF